MKELWTRIDFSPTTFELPENLEAEEKEDNMEGDMHVNKTNEVEKKEMPKATREKLTGLKINNFPKEITEEEVVKFLKDNVKGDLDSVNFNLTNTESKYNKSIVVFSGMNPEEIEAAIEKIDFKQKFYEKPLYCKALENITHDKNNSHVGDENKQDEEEEEDKNEQNEDLEDEMESGEDEAIIKPKFTEENNKKKGRLGSTNQSEKIDKYVTPARCQTKPYQS